MNNCHRSSIPIVFEEGFGFVFIKALGVFFVEKYWDCSCVFHEISKSLSEWTVFKDQHFFSRIDRANHRKLLAQGLLHLEELGRRCPDGCGIRAPFS